MMALDHAVVWHDVECGGYVEDLALWHELARAHGAGGVLDVGAGTGRVALDLARAGHAVCAVDLETAFLAELERRAGGLPVRTHAADARTFALGERFSLILAPMQTVQLLDGPDGRAGFLQACRAHLAPGGVVACALADALDAFDAEHCVPPLPDERTIGDVRFCSQPVALRDLGNAVVIERIRTTYGPGAERSATGDSIRLDRVAPAKLEAEAAAAGLAAAPRRAIRQTDEHVGSTVVVLRG